MQFASMTAGLAVAALLAAGGAQRLANHHATPTAATAAASSTPAAPTKPAVIPPTVIGMNLGMPVSYSTEWVFADTVKNNGWLKKAGTENLDGITLDGGGHPINVPKGTLLDLALYIAGPWRVGMHNCAFSPGWTVTSPWRGRKIGGDEKFKLDVPQAEGGNFVVLQVLAQKDNARLDTASCTLASYPPGAVFTPAFLEDMRPFRVIRFMDWMATNGAPPRTWADRPKPTDISFLRQGMPIEYMVDIANTLGSDPWFTLPFDADPDYYRNFAIYVRDHLAPGQRAYVELSNEVWNTGFKQSQDALARGKKLYPGDDIRATDYYYGDRVREVMKVWTEVFAGQEKRIVRVVGGQAGWKERSEQLLAHNDLYKSVDAYAVAPYFGHTIQDIAEQGKPRIDQVLARLHGEGKAAIDRIADQKAAIAHFGLRFIAYEGGPEVSGFSPDAQRDASMIQHDPRFHEVYTDYLDNWRKRIGDVLVLYSGTSGTIYGHKDYTGQPLSDAPKMAALVDYIKRYQQ